MGADPTLEQLTAAIRDIQSRVEQRHPQTAKGNLPLANLLPVVHARDRAESKIAAIGAVNPRPPGLLNNLIQSAKRTIARALGWFVRDQIEFNRASLQCIEALLEAHNETNRALAELADRLETVKVVDLDPLKQEAQHLADLRLHWHQWRQEWERKLSLNEAQFLRGLADLQLAYQQKLALAESQFREHLTHQHRDYLDALDRSTEDIQRKLWADLKQMRADHHLAMERLIHQELRSVRQKPVISAPALTATASSPEVRIDWWQFAYKFRGPEDEIRRRFARYVPVFAGCVDILDLGCGRGEFLSLVPAARGIDSSAECVAICQQKGLAAVADNIFDFLERATPASSGGIFCAQVIEHLPAHLLPELVKLCARVLRPGAPIVFETPNPECLAIFATHFYLDPTHVRPVPPALMHFYLEESGFGAIEIERLGTAANDFPELAALPEPLRQRFFGAMDYAVTARRL